MKASHLFLIILVALNANVVFSQEDQDKDHLQPLDGVFGIYDYQVEYYSAVRKKLFDDFSDRFEVRFICMPSFFSDYAFQVEMIEGKGEQKPKYFLKYHIVNESLSRNESSDTIDVRKYKKEISKTSVELLKKLFCTAILGVSYDPPPAFTEQIIDGQIVLTRLVTIIGDGERFYFFINDLGIKGGQTHSPYKESNMGKLVAISKRIIEMVTNDEIDKIDFDKDLEKEVIELTNQIK